MVMILCRRWTAIVFFMCALVMMSALSAEAADTYSRVYMGKDFRQTRDSIRSESPMDGGVQVVPLIRDVDVMTQFSVPDDARGLCEWRVSAVIRSAAGTRTGVVMRTDDRIWTLSISNNGEGSLRSFSGKKLVDRHDFAAKNISWPMTLTIWRDMNGSIVGRINEAVVAAVIYEYDAAGPKISDVLSIGISTTSDGSPNAHALYDRVEVSGSGRVERPPTLREVLLGE